MDVNKLSFKSKRSQRSKLKFFIDQKKNYSIVAIFQPKTWKFQSQLLNRPGLRPTGGPRGPGFASNRPAHGSASCARVWWLPSPTRRPFPEKAGRRPSQSRWEVGSAFFARASEVHPVRWLGSNLGQQEIFRDSLFCLWSETIFWAQQKFNRGTD